MASIETYNCKLKSCGKKFLARTADRKRGWAIFCSKRCKAIEQEGRTKQRRIFQGCESTDHEIAMAAMEDGWDGHKNAF